MGKELDRFPRRARRPEPLPGSRARPGEGEGSEAEAEPKRPRGTARDRALTLLSFRDRSSSELERRLLRAGFDRQEVTEAIGGLTQAGLVDDERFARALVEHHSANRMAGRRAVRTALFTAGVDRATADRALEGMGEDADRAEALAERRAARMTGLPPHVAHRRLTDFLMRRGHAPAIAREAARRALGIDTPEP